MYSNRISNLTLISEILQKQVLKLIDLDKNFRRLLVGTDDYIWCKNPNISVDKSIKNKCEDLRYLAAAFDDPVHSDLQKAIQSYELLHIRKDNNIPINHKLFSKYKPKFRKAINLIREDLGNSDLEFFESIQYENLEHLKIFIKHNKKSDEEMQFNDIVWYKNGTAFFVNDEEKKKMVDLCEKYEDELLNAVKEECDNLAYDMSGFSPIQEYAGGHFIRTNAYSSFDDEYCDSDVGRFSGSWKFQLNLIGDKLHLCLYVTDLERIWE